MRPLLLLLSALVGLNAQPEANLFTPSRLKAFGDYLFIRGDYLRAAMEYERYLYLNEGNDDSTLFKVGLCHELRGRHDFAAQTFETLATEASGQLAASARLALLHNLARGENWERIAASGSLEEGTFYHHYAARVALDPTFLDSGYFDIIKNDSLRMLFLTLEKERQEIRPKRPWVAASLSAVMPGLGKAYNGRGLDGLYALAATVFSGYVAYNAFAHERVVSGLGSAALAVSFYLGDIYGSYVGARIDFQERQALWRARLGRLDPVLAHPYLEQWLAQ
ncbi:MAG: hypothetical protein JSU77_10480 [Fidelibacterota bacterium]|nr:MAG: hypothetical protein JSU77_10480 [Candidatus Neomarinimicrobiota bacterium]